jgi:putative membrane protein
MVMSGRPNSERFFTEPEKEKIVATVCDVESRTVGEVVVMVVDSSDPYVETEFVGGLLGSSSLSLVLSVLLFHASLFWFIAFTLLFIIPFYFLFARVASLKALFIGARRRDEVVRERAMMAFFEKGLHRTRENTGVLFFLSLLERKVWVLADRGIYDKIGQETLNQFAIEVSRGVKQGRVCEALIEAIQGVGRLLSAHFPVKPGDINELPDKVITG